MSIDYKAAFTALVERLDGCYSPICERDVDTEWGPEARMFSGTLEVGADVVVVLNEDLDAALDAFYNAEARGEK